MDPQTLSLPPLGLYVHIPWCVRKCPYCDFNSHRQPASLPEEEYITALLKDFREELPLTFNRPLVSIFIGGGTPSLFKAESFDRLIRGISQEIDFAPDIEITLEANPGTFETEKFAAYRDSGINRLSIGIQSFNELQLQKLGRIHGSEEALNASVTARAAGFSNFNLDLMFGLPGQSLNEALTDLQTAIMCKPSHLSWYQLTIEPNTEFYRHPPVLPQDDALAAIQESGIALLEQHGYARYEISAFARTHSQSRHNRNYWEFGDYMGIGAGAHGKFTLPENNSIIRTRKRKMPAHYLDNNTSMIAGSETVAENELALEFMMNAMRLVEGVPITLLPTRTGIDPRRLAGELDRLQARGLLTENRNRLQPSSTGLSHLNEVLLAFMP